MHDKKNNVVQMSILAVLRRLKRPKVQIQIETSTKMYTPFLIG